MGHFGPPILKKNLNYSNVIYTMMAITTSSYGKFNLAFPPQNCDFKVIIVSYGKIESNNYTPVLLNLFNSLRKGDKMLAFCLFSSACLINQ